MAAIVARGKKYCVVYPYVTDSGEKKQKWESYDNKADALRRKSEIEYKQTMGSVIIPQCETLNDLLKEYISMYGKNNWALSIYSSNVNMIASYIQPYIGSMKLEDITARVLEKYYQNMLKTVHTIKETWAILPSACTEIIRLIRSAVISVPFSNSLIVLIKK